MYTTLHCILHTNFIMLLYSYVYYTTHTLLAYTHTLLYTPTYSILHYTHIHAILYLHTPILIYILYIYIGKHVYNAMRGEKRTGAGGGVARAQRDISSIKKIEILQTGNNSLSVYTYVYIV